jgi:hypothetical protein
VIFAAVLDHLRARGLVVVETRDGAVAQCPAHDDRHPSLHLTMGRDGRTLGICRAGCRAEEWTAAAGLRLGNLFATTTMAPARPRPCSSLAAMRVKALAIGRRQAWARPAAVEQAAAADAIRSADRARATADNTDDGWELLAEAARVTTLAENILAETGGA